MESGEFIRPPEAPVFQPTAEEFKDPVSYISKIRPVVLNTGICKIKPPLGWKPPFAISVDNFRFTPRLQPLNELEANTRVKLNFLDNLAKFWDMQGVSFKIPVVNRCPLDLHQLFKVVTSNGGFEEVCSARKWVFVAREMKFDNIAVSGSLRVNYEKFLYPYELCQVNNGALKLHKVKRSSSTDIPVGLMRESEGNLVEEISDNEDMAFDNNKSSDNQYRRSKRKRSEDPDYNFDISESNPEFKKLAFSAPGPKNVYVPMKRSSRRCVSRYRTSQGDTESNETVSENKVSTVKVLSNVDSKIACHECGYDYCEEEILCCFGCSTCYHVFCLAPPLTSLPTGSWYCPRCIAKECCQAPDPFGFEQAKKLYSLQTFGQMANQFKADYFNEQPTDVAYATVEKEFWRLVGSVDDDVTVEYGADLHSSRHGSGFPTHDPCSGSLSVPGAEEYANSGWNLNNLPVLKGSVLGFIDADISGMKVPWLYVGMCFSCFCWHTEDHWSYSINYLHWGEAKTWYGVPSAYADALEATMKEQAPELFENQPDLMHHLATTLNPSLLIKNGIPVVRTDQCAGEFVVTFPRAYHAGFNQGFNFAEAVNFSLADWLPVGRESIEHYRLTQKSPVFSHDELICKIVAKPDDLDLTVLVMASKDAETMFSVEEQLRHSVKCNGVQHEKKEIFELLPDDDRQCCICKTCCFLSGVRCSCCPKLMACLHHYKELCHCVNSDKSLRFRYSLSELRQLMSTAQERASMFCLWAKRVDSLLDGLDQPKPDLQYMQALVLDGKNKQFTNCEQYNELVAAIGETERILGTIYDIMQPKSKDLFVSVHDLKQVLQDVLALPCVLPEADKLQVHLHTINAYQEEVVSTLSAMNENSTTSDQDIQVLHRLLEQGEQLSLDIPQLGEIRNAIDRLVWIKDINLILDSNKKNHIDTLKSMYKKGQTLYLSRAVGNALEKLKNLLGAVQEWEHKVKTSLKEKPPHPISFFEAQLKGINQLPVTVPLADTLSLAIDEAKKWNDSAQEVQAADKHPHYGILKELLSSAHPISMRLDQLPQVESRYSAAKAWVDRTSRTFLKKNYSSSLIDVLLPRGTSPPVSQQGKGQKKKNDDEYSIQGSALSLANGDRLQEMDLIHDMEKKEMEYIRKIRKFNIDKQQQEDDSSPVLYCLCNKPESGYMLQCEVCNEWYHANCLHIPKSKLNQDSDISKEMRFICGSCLRSRRPRLDAIVSLLISLQKVPVAISEGTALHCLAERAISWQKQARELLGATRAVIEEAKSQQLRLVDIRKKISRWKQEASQESAEGHSQLAYQTGSVLKHYESQLSKEKATYAGLTEAQRKNVEEMLLAGDLLEVTTDETTQLWQVLQTDSDCISYYTMTEEEAMKNCAIKVNLAPSKKFSMVLEEAEDTSTSFSTSATLKKRRKGTGEDATLEQNQNKKKKGMGKQIEKKKSSPSKASRRRHSPAVDNQTLTEASDDERDEQGSDSNEDAICSAPQCIRPMASQISWVQCDLCQLWFHLLCVGLTPESVEKIDIYNCCVCKQKCISERKALIDSAVQKKSITMLNQRTSIRL